MKLDYMRVIGDKEMFSRQPAEVYSTPLGGAVLVRKNSLTAQALKRWSTSSIDAAACLQPEMLQTVHPGLKAELLYSQGLQVEAVAFLHASKRARDYILALVHVRRYDGESGHKLDEFQSLTRSISAAAECFDILEELGLEGQR